jgi:ABC-type antimicrobial peptide transport system permease subunit
MFQAVEMSSRIMRLPRFSRFSFFLLAALIASKVSAQSVAPVPGQNVSSEASLRKDVEFLSKLPSRVPGTPGNIAAADYVKTRFNQIGLEQVRADSYLVTAPVTKEGSLSIGGKEFQIHPVYPNQVVASTTPEAGITGRLVYAGMGRPSDFNGQKIEGSIVALDFNSGMNWITAVDLGAKAIVFLENSAADRGQAERKFTFLPVEVPRFYAPEVVANAIRTANGTSATVKSLVVWEKVPVSNVLGFLKGKNPPPSDKPNTLIVNAYYDSMSVVPDLAPGAEAAGNCAAMLELATRLKKNPPAYNVLFVANGAHHLALAGTRNFIAKHAIDSDGKATDEKKAEIASYRAFINLDLTSKTETVGFFAKSWFYNQMTVASENILLNQFSGLAKSLGRYVEDEAKQTKTPVEEVFVDGVTGKDGRTWRSYLPSLVALDSEVATMAALPGVSFATANDARLLQDTPFDTADKIVYSNLSAQIETTEKLFRHAVTNIIKGDAEGSPVIPAPATLSKNFGFVVGRGIYRDVEKATSFLPDTPLPDSQLDPKRFAGIQAVGAVVSNRDGNPLEQKSYAGVRGIMIERATYSKAGTNSPAVAQFIFMGPRVGDPKGGGTPGYEFEAFSMNRDGHIIFAPDRGSERQRFSPSFNKAVALLDYKDEKLGLRNVGASLICFQGRAVTIFDTLDQRYFTVLKEMTVLDAKTDASPVEYGFLRPNAGPGGGEIEPIGVIFSKPEERFKLIMAAGLLGKRLVILNTSAQNADSSVSYEGRGFETNNTPETNRITKIAYQTATDLWTLNQQRIRLLKGFGINNERVDQLHGEAGCGLNDKGVIECPTDSVTAPNGGSLLLAKTALESQKYDTFYREARRAFGLESRAYPDVEATSQDVLKGIIFYLALLLPFAYFMERMLFGFPDVRKQIVGTSLVFLAVFAAIRFVHPAFELALTPFIILLAFVILALTVVVTAFLQSKFEQEIKRMKQGVHYADMGRLSALGAALGLGIANMRRRPTRTALTCVTLILLTFTVLSFTSVTANIANFARPYGDEDRTPAYQGFLIRQPDWSAMTEVAVASLQNEIVALNLGQPALRAWYLSRDQGEALQLRVSNSTDQSKFYYAPALVGMTPDEQRIGSPVARPENLIKGRWLREGDTNVCLLPRDVLLSDAERAAERKAIQEAQGNTQDDSSAVPTEELGPPLGLTMDNAVGSVIQVSGKSLEVIGIFDDRKWYGSKASDNLRDLDNEEFSPVDYGSDQTKQNAQANSNASQSGDEVQVQRYEHMRANALLVLPYQTALNMGATTRSMAVGITDPAAQKELDDLMGRAALGIFGATPDATKGGKLVAKLYSSVEATSYEGFASLAVPIIIAALIIANTMLGSVYERTREIGIYSSIGLAPVHIGALFIAEAAVYAVLGSISGYLIAQVVAKIITATNALPGITLNYSSSSAVISTLIVMATVFLSTLYPAWAASKISNPEGKKSDLGDPIGDLWRLQFPFTVSGLQSLGMAQFLADFFESHTDTSVGKFYTDKVHFNALTLSDSVDVLNNGVSPIAPVVNTAGSGSRKGPFKKKISAAEARDLDNLAQTDSPPPRNGFLKLEDIAAAPDAEVYRLSMRTWLAPFDMGVSQDTDIILLPSNEPGLYELQLRLERKSGEIAAWKRVNREFMTELRKQLLVWRTVKPEVQQEYILRGRAHINEQRVSQEEPSAVVV